MLSKALNLLKRKRKDDMEVNAKKETEKETGNGNIFSRALLKIRRKIIRACQGSNIQAICVERSPCSPHFQQYMVTPAQVKPAGNELPREYMWNEFVDIRESRTFEFKTGGGAYPIQILPEHIRKYGSAFLNCDGGVLIAGILDNGRVHGIFCDWRMEMRICDTLEKEILQFYPRVDRSLYSVRFVPVYDRRQKQFIRNTKVVEILFKGGDPLALYETGEHKVFLRREGSVEGPLTPLQIKDVVLRKYKKVLVERREQDRTLLSP